MPDLRAWPASGAASWAVTWRGLPGTNTKPAKQADRAARRSAPQFSPHNLVRPNSRSRAACAGSGAFISEEPIRKASTWGASRSTCAWVAIPDSETSTRPAASDARRSEVAVVDADERRSERDRAAHFRFVMDLDQRVHPEAPRFVHHGPCVVVAEKRQNHQHGVRSGDPGLGDLAQVDHEILGENRSVEMRPRGGEIVDRAAEICPVAQDAEGIGYSRITSSELGWVRARTD